VNTYFGTRIGDWPAEGAVFYFLESTHADKILAMLKLQPACQNNLQQLQKWRISQAVRLLVSFSKIRFRV
jgi:hypothetical protein